jgi:UDP-N-acetylmuramate dehydrogenase
MKRLIQENIALSPLTTLGIGGPARYFAEARGEDAVLEAIEFAETRELPLMILGGGSNLLVSDGGFPGLVLQVGIGGLNLTDTGQGFLIRAGSGIDWDQVVAQSVEQNLYGIECLSGIPGWAGGTPIQNVGAYGQEVSEVITAVRVYDRQEGIVRELCWEDCSFSYRSSVFNTTARGRHIVLVVEYDLKNKGRPKTDYPDLKRYFDGHSDPNLAEVREAVQNIRASKAMLRMKGDPDCASAGSFFKNPIMDEAAYTELVALARKGGILAADEDIPHYRFADGLTKVPAAWLIECAGYKKGVSDGPVGLSEKHVLAVINRGGAKAEDVLRFAGDIQSSVEDRLGVRLVTEPVFAGFSDEVIARFSAVRA